MLVKNAYSILILSGLALHSLAFSPTTTLTQLSASTLKAVSNPIEEEAANPSPSGDEKVKHCYWESPEGMCRTETGDFRPVKGGWKQRLQLKDLEVGQMLIGEKISKADLLEAKTGPKIYYECGVGRIDGKGNWQMVSGMLRVAKSFAKPSVVKKKVQKLTGKPVELIVHKVSVATGTLEVQLSSVESKEELEKETPKVPASTLKVGQELIGKIVQLRSYGCLVDVGANRLGLLHIQRVADLFDRYIDKEEGLGEVGLERGASIKVAVKSNDKKKLFLDFIQETKDVAAEEAAAFLKEKEDAKAKRIADDVVRQREKEEAAAAAAAAALGFGTIEEEVEESSGEDSSAPVEISDDEAAAWAAYADDYADDDDEDYDEDADIEDSLGIGSY